MRTVLVCLAFLFFAGGIFVMTNPIQEAPTEVEAAWTFQPDAPFNLSLIGGLPGGSDCWIACTDGCPGICRLCCTVDGELECQTFSNGCNPG